jgi:hypothetical protein
VALATTVPNCGGGAYEPKTLLIVCGNGPTAVDSTATSWQSWSRSAATGTGTVHLAVAGRAVAAAGRLRLDDVVTGPVGPQFRRLTVTWIGASPDGRPSDLFALQAGA